MDVQISYQDARSMFVDTIVEYKGSLVYFYTITEQMVAYLRELSTGKVRRVPFQLKDFSYPKGRLGYINLGDIAFYLVRHPYRIYKFGISSNSIRAGESDFRYTHEDAELISRTIQDVNNTFLAEALEGVFPSFEEAVKKVQNREARLVAFDHQLAISYKGGIYFKGRFAGQYPILEEGADFNKIVWTDEYKVVGKYNQKVKK